MFKSPLAAQQRVNNTPVNAAMSGRQVALGLRIRRPLTISYRMQGGLLQVPRQQVGKLLHIRSSLHIGGYLTVKSPLGCASVVLAIKPLSTLRGALHSSRIFSSSFSTFTRFRLSPSSTKPYKCPQRSFSNTSITMTATKIDGTAIAKTIRERLHAEIEATQKTNPRYKPSLKIIQGSSPDKSFLE